MIFIVKESLLNGTVTMKTTILGINAPSFVDAKRQLVEKLAESNCSQGQMSYDGAFCYTAISEMFTVVGTLEPTPLQFIDDASS